MWASSKRLRQGQGGEAVGAGQRMCQTAKPELGMQALLQQQ
jgi:hypothetical protein